MMTPIRTVFASLKLVTDREASTFYDAEDLEVVINMARTYLEQWSKDGAYSWVLRPARGGGFAITLARGQWHFVIGPLDADISLINQAREHMDATDERIEVDARIRAVHRMPKRSNKGSTAALPPQAGGARTKSSP